MRPPRLPGSAVPAAVFVALLATALPATALFGGSDPIHVPEPHLGDEVAYATRAKGEETGVPSRAFTWSEGIVTTDRWGRAAQADLLRTYTRTMGMEGERWEETAAAFAGGEVRPLWTTLHVNHSGMGRMGWGPFEGDSEFRFDANLTFYSGGLLAPDCSARHGLQGKSIEAGDEVAFEDVCPGMEALGLDARFLRSEAADFLGRPAVALHYAVDESPGDEAGSVTGEFRLLFADGLPYPAEMTYSFQGRAVDGRTGTTTTEQAENSGPSTGPREQSTTVAVTPAPDAHTFTEVLTGFSRGNGGPLRPTDPALASEPPARPGATFAPITRAGPADGDANFAYPLSAAVTNVESDPTLTRFQAWRQAHPDALLLQARYQMDRESRDPAGATEETRAAWDLTFADASGDGYRVRTEKAKPRALAGTPLDPVTDAAVRSEEVGPYETDGPVPRASDLPRGMDLASALAAWLTHAPTDAASAPNRLEYRVEGDADGTVQYRVAVGHVPLQGADGGSHRQAELVLDATTGAAAFLAETTLQRSGHPFLPFMAAPLPAAPARGGIPLLGGGPDGVEFVAGAAGVSVLAAILAALAYKLGWFTPLFTRLKRTEILDNDLRRALYEQISREPGVHLNALAERTRAGNGAVTYHLNTLEREGLVRSVELPGYRRYFVTGSASPEAMRALAELRAGSARTIYDVVRANPGISTSDVARRVGISAPAVHKTVVRLENAGLIRKAREGRLVRLTARDPNRLN